MNIPDTAVPIRGAPDYFITPDAEVWSTKSGAPRKRGISKYPNGYTFVGLSVSGKVIPWLLHRLVAIHFIPTDDASLDVNHKNSIRNDNRVENLEWLTRSENVKHGYSNGFNQGRRGSGSHLAKLNEDSVREIRTLREQGKTTRVLADQYGVTTHMIRHLCARKSWRHVA